MIYLLVRAFIKYLKVENVFHREFSYIWQAIKLLPGQRSFIKNDISKIKTKSQFFFC